jgi:hypothetical protein
VRGAVGAWAWLVAALQACAPGPPRAPETPGVAATSGGARSIVPAIARAGERDESPSELLELVQAPDAPRCPTSFEHHAVLLARVGGEPLTGCDLALDALRATREGVAPESPSAAASALVRDAVFAREATVRGLSQDPTVRARIDQTLADAVVRAQARVGFAVPDRAAIERYFAQHRADFDRAARVHVRAIAVEHEQDARSILDALRAQGARFEELAVARSVLTGARRDQGDLGLVDRDGSELVPAAVAAIAHGLEAFGALAPDPVPIQTSVTVSGSRRRRPRVRVQTRWYVVQRLERVDAEPATVESAARRIAFRLVRDGWTARVDAARASLLESARARDPVTIDPSALRRVALRIEPPRRRGRVAGARRR